MSPIGRIFIVLNLILAGGFFYFSGVYLQKATDWKKQHDDLQTSSTEREQRDAATIEALESEKRDAERKLAASEQTKNALEATNQQLEAKNQQLDKQLNTIQAELAGQAANWATVSSTIETSSREFAEATKTAIQAGKERDDAVRAAEVAKADLRDANDRISALEASISENQQLIARLEQDKKEMGIQLELVRTKAPHLLGELAQPQLAGRVERVDGNKLLTVLITDDPAEAGAKPGYSFAIYDGTNYKGEALVTGVDGNFAFCRVTRSTGREIRPGDQASTITN